MFKKRINFESLLERCIENMIEYEGTAYLLQLKESCNEQERVWLDEVANEIWERRKKREK